MNITRVGATSVRDGLPRPTLDAGGYPAHVIWYVDPTLLLLTLLRLSGQIDRLVSQVLISNLNTTEWSPAGGLARPYAWCGVEQTNTLVAFYGVKQTWTDLQTFRLVRGASPSDSNIPVHTRSSLTHHRRCLDGVDPRSQHSTPTPKSRKIARLGRPGRRGG